MTREQRIRESRERRERETARRNAERTATSLHLQSGGRFIYRPKGRRMVTVAYRRNDDGTLSYGAVIFKKDSPSEQYSKSVLRQQALERLSTAPVTVETPKVDHVGELDHYVRRCLPKHGCHS